jgi:hypothetical protein
MSGEIETDLPAAGSVVELTATSRSDTLVAWSEGCQDAGLFVAAPLDQLQRPVTLGIGERLHLYWRNGGELRALPVVLAAIESGERPRWCLRVDGVLHRGQRREAVRAPLSVPVRIGPEGASTDGMTVDVSEGGCRCILARGRPTFPSVAQAVGATQENAGEVVRASVLFPEFTITCLAEVMFRHAREDAREEFSLRFIGLTELQQDLIRRHVFTRLRELRNRGLL